MEESLQDLYAPNSACFGCGPKNERGLRLKSFPSGDRVVASWKPSPEHIAFGNFGNGGIISVLMDCQGNWASTFSLMKERGMTSPPGTVTAEYTVRFIRPSPIDGRWDLSAWPTKIDGDRVFAAGELKVQGETTATMKGLFVAVKESHPAFHRWR